MITATAYATAIEVIQELKKKNLLKDDKQSPFQKTETLLYNYRNFKEAIEDKLEQIRFLEEEGLPKKSSSISSFSKQPIYEMKNDSDKVNDKIEAIELSIQTTRNYVYVIDNAIKMLRNDPYYEIIGLKYLEGKSREDIAEYFDVDVSTISRNKNRLINLLQIRLFSDEVIYQIFH
jgi:hypothetical protein